MWPCCKFSFLSVCYKIQTKSSENKQETWQTYTFSGTVRIEEPMHNNFLVIRNASDLDRNILIPISQII